MLGDEIDIIAVKSCRMQNPGNFIKRNGPRRIGSEHVFVFLYLDEVREKSLVFKIEVCFLRSHISNYSFL